MRFFTFLVITFFNSQLWAADFQLPDYVLGTAKAEMSKEVLAKTSVSIFSTEATIEPQWSEDKLVAVQLTFYKGTDYEALNQKTSLLLTQWISTFGSVAWLSADTAPKEDVTPDQYLALLDQLMKTAAQTASAYKQSHLANSTLVLDFQPVPQPDNSRLHLSVIYSSLSGDYSLELFIDEKTAAERTSPAIVNLEAF